MKVYIVLFVLVLAGCEVKADAIKACGEACKEHGGVLRITYEVCECRR